MPASMPIPAQKPGDAYSRLSAGARDAASSPLNRQAPPTDAQAAAGNYKLGTSTWHGLGLRIENPINSIRSGVGERGKRWSNTMAAHYGYIAGTRGADGDAVDVFIGPHPESTAAFVLNQNQADGQFDEHKVLIGFADEAAALSAYTHSYSPGWNRFDRRVFRVTPRQLRWWLKYADTSRRFHPSQIPLEKTMDTAAQDIDARVPRMFWNPDATPASGRNLAGVLYELRALDGAEGLMFDPMTMGELTEGLEVETMDSLVVEAGRLKPKMEALMRLMEMTGDKVKPVAVQFSDVLRRFGGAHVAAIYELSDGQTITAWFHNPDATPAKLTPADSLIAWKWLLNKRDITAAVSPESGSDLNPREVSRRVMKLAEKNSAAFARVNSNRAAKMAAIQGLKDELGAKQSELAGLHDQIATERPAAEARKAQREADAQAAAAAAEAAAAEAGKPAWQRSGFSAATPEGYAAVLEGGEAAALANQDELDSEFGRRMVDTRNALRDLGWEGPMNKTLAKAGHSLTMDLIQVGGGRNVVGVTWGVSGTEFTLRDDFTQEPAAMAAAIDGALPQVTQEAPAAAPSFLDEFGGGPFAAITEEQTGAGPSPSMPASLMPTITKMRALAIAGDAAGIDALARDPASLAGVAQGDVWVYAEARQLLSLMRDQAAADLQPEPAVQPEPDSAPDLPAVATLRDVVAGKFDGLGVSALYSKVSQSVVELSDSGALTGEVEALANEAIDHWARLDEKLNG